MVGPAYSFVLVTSQMRTALRCERCEKMEKKKNMEKSRAPEVQSFHSPVSRTCCRH